MQKPAAHVSFVMHLLCFFAHLYSQQDAMQTKTKKINLTLQKNYVGTTKAKRFVWPALILKGYQVAAYILYNNYIKGKYGVEI